MQSAPDAEAKCGTNVERGDMSTDVLGKAAVELMQVRSPSK